MESDRLSARLSAVREATLAALRSPAGAVLAASLVLAAAMFQLVFGWGLVGAGAAYWRSPYGDMVAMLAGAEAIFRDPWTFPLTATRRLTSPEMSSAIYTDSIPWLLVVMKALGLQHLFSPLGLFFALSYLLQPIAMICLLRAAGARRWMTLAVGAALALLLPTWIVRQFGHVALSGHFVVIFALALSVVCARRGLTPARVLVFCGLGALAVGLHAYHVVPVAAAFAAALLSEVLQRRPGAVGRAGGAILRFGLATAVAAFVLGYGIGEAISGGAGAVGYYSMNLAAPIWPQASTLAGQRWDTATGWFTGGGIGGPPGQDFEGFAYLGGGVLLLVLAALVTLAPRWRTGSASGETWRRFGPLAAAMLALTLWAVGPRAYLGGLSLVDIPIREGLIGDLLGMFRAHGRFIWAPTYGLLALVLIRLETVLRPRLFAALAVVAVAVQAVDVSGLLAQIRARYAEPWPVTYPAELEAPVFAARPWVFLPRYYCTHNPRDQVTLSQLSLLAIRTGGAASSTNTARNPGGGCDAHPEQLVDAAPSDPRITVVIDRKAGETARFAQLSARTDCRRFPTLLVCGRGATTSAASELRDPFELSFLGPAPAPALTKGWSATEADGTWTAAGAARIAFLAPIYADQGMTLRLRAFAFLHGGLRTQGVLVTSNEIRLTRWQVGGDAPADYRVDIPPGLARAGQPFFVDVTISNPIPVSDFVPGSADTRSLGIKAQSLRVGPLEPPPS